VFPDKSNDGADPFGCDWFRSSASCGEGLGFWIPRPGLFSFVPSVVAGGGFDLNGASVTGAAPVKGPHLQPTIGYPR
jgi:hypothetical protein